MEKANQNNNKENVEPEGQAVEQKCSKIYTIEGK